MTPQPVIVKLVDYSCYMQECHLRAIRSEWKDGKTPTVTVEPECAATKRDKPERGEAMNKQQKLLAAEFLKTMSDEYGSHGCNDCDLPNTPENYSMMQDAQLWNVNGNLAEAYPVRVSDDGKTIFTQDYFVIGYLAQLLEDEAKLMP